MPCCGCGVLSVKQSKHIPLLVRSVGTETAPRSKPVPEKKRKGQKMTRKEIKIRAGKTARKVREAVERGDDARVAILIDRLGRLCGRLACVGVVTASMWFDHFTRANGLGVM